MGAQRTIHKSISQESQNSPILRQSPRLNTELVSVGQIFCIGAWAGSICRMRANSQTLPTPLFQTMQVKTAAADTSKVAGGGGCSHTKAQSRPVSNIHLPRAPLCWFSPQSWKQVCIHNRCKVSINSSLVDLIDRFSGFSWEPKYRYTKYIRKIVIDNKSIID